MRVYELHRKQVLGEGAWPVKGFHARIDVEVDFGDVDVPAKAQRQMVLNLLKHLLAEARPEDLAGLARPIHATAATPEPEEPEEDWRKPEDLDLRIIKSAHRVITEVARRGSRGREVLASELVGSIGLSAPTLGRLLREGEPGYAYLAKYLIISPKGRTKALDLTPEGRVLASKVRAGVVPA